MYIYTYIIIYIYIAPRVATIHFPVTSLHKFAGPLVKKRVLLVILLAHGEVDIRTTRHRGTHDPHDHGHEVV